MRLPNHRGGSCLRLASASLTASLLAASAMHSAETAAPPSPVVPIESLGQKAHGTGVTYLELLRNVFPGLTVSEKEPGSATLAREKVLRRIGTKERSVVSEGSVLDGLREMKVRGDGKVYRLLAAEVRPGDPTDPDWPLVVVVFPESGREALDVADLKDDRFCAFGTPARFPLGPEDGFHVTSTHFNSNQGYAIDALYHVRKGRLRQIASVFTLTVKGACGGSFAEKLTFDSAPETGRTHPAVRVKVEVTHGEGEPDDCPKKRKKRLETFEELFRWNPSKELWAPSGTALERLRKLNEANL